MDALEFLKPFEDFRARSGDSYNISALKAAMKSRGLDFGPARLPQRRLTPSEEQELTSLTKALSIAEGTYPKSRVVTVS
jgi:4-hydroxy-tetrahydrodipicolinate synthase